MDTRNRYDFVIVGAGAAGLLIASELAKAGVRVLCVDKGPLYRQEDFHLKHDEIKYYARGAMVPGLTTDPITWRPHSGAEARLAPWADSPLGAANPLHLPPSLGSGGGSLHWGGACWRFRESEFRMKSTIEDRLGKHSLPENSTLVDWPISYADLEPYYDRVEWELGICGEGSNVEGEPQKNANPWAPPRRRDYPMPPLAQPYSDRLFAEACSRLGYHPFRTAAAIASVPYGGRPACSYCGFCHGYPCHTGAKTSPFSVLLPTAMDTGNLDFLEYCRVMRLNVSNDRTRVVSITYRDASGAVRDLLVDQIVLSCYALENARLLLVSGINDNGQVGRHLMTHAFGFIMGLTPEPCNPFMGTLVASSSIEDFSGELIHDYDVRALWGAPIISWPGDFQPIEVIHALPPTAPRWGADLLRWMESNYLHVWAMYSQTANIPTTETYVDLDPHHRDPYGQPALRMTHSWSEWDARSVEALLKVKRAIAQEMGLTQWWEEEAKPMYHLSTHEVGTHRMGWDPRTSVVDVFGRSHQCRNLFVVGGGQFPSYGGYNPTETIWALAYMTVDHILGRV